MTGVDRVEHAWLGHLAGLDRPVFGLVRSALGFLLVDRAAMQALHDGTLDTGFPDLAGRIALRHDSARAGAEAALRRRAVARCLRPGLARMLRRHLPVGAGYLNTGHADLDDRTLRAIQAAGLRIAVLVHDVIPLDHPEFARAGSVAPFRRKLAAVSRHADLVIHSTEDVRQHTEAQLRRLGRCPEALVARLGVTPPRPTPEALPFRPEPPWFVCLGTIEPRKNHALLLDVWARLPPPQPRLYLIGRRGWASAGLLSRLDALAADGPVRELPGLGDGAVAALLDGATALLFPSFAEGFGLPAVEAAALGVPVIAADLAVFHELLADFPIYLDPHDSYSWLETIDRMARSGRPRKDRIEPPGWAVHFNTVLSRL